MTGGQAAWVVSLSGDPPQRLGAFSWNGTHWPFLLTASGDLLSTGWSGTKTTLWLAEYP